MFWQEGSESSIDWKRFTNQNFSRSDLNVTLHKTPRYSGELRKSSFIHSRSKPFVPDIILQVLPLSHLETGGHFLSTNGKHAIAIYISGNWRHPSKHWGCRSGNPAAYFRRRHGHAETLVPSGDPPNRWKGEAICGWRERRVYELHKHSWVMVGGELYLEISWHFVRDERLLWCSGGT